MCPVETSAQLTGLTTRQADLGAKAGIRYNIAQGIPISGFVTDVRFQKHLNSQFVQTA